MWKTLNLPEMNFYLKENIRKEGQSSSDSDEEEPVLDEEHLKSMPQMHFDLKPVIKMELFKLQQDKEELNAEKARREEEDDDPFNLKVEEIEKRNVHRINSLK